MKKIVLLDKSEREAFLNYCEAIRNAEADKDTFLKAARLERHEAQPEKPRLDSEDLVLLIVLSMIILPACSLIALAILKG